MRSNKGSISLFVLIAMLFFLVFVTGVYIANINSESVEAKASKRIQEVYGKDVNDMDSAYEAVMNKYCIPINEMFNNDDSGTIRIGHYVDYNPYLDPTTTSYTVDGLKSTSDGSVETQAHMRESLQWRVLDKTDDGRVRLISAAPTTFSLILQGANGYNNAVKLIDEVCAIYGGSKGTAQGLKIEDIEGCLTSTALSTVHGGSYGSPFAPSNKNYPLIFAQENKQLGNGAIGKLRLSQQDNWYIEPPSPPPAAILNTTYTFWSKTMTSGDWTNGTYQTLFIVPMQYWIASRCFQANATYGYFHVYFGGTIITAYELYVSDNRANPYDHGVRPVVTLNADVKVDITNPIKNGSSSVNAWVLR